MEFCVKQIKKYKKTFNLVKYLIKYTGKYDKMLLLSRFIKYSLGGN